jgi:hypothetical protein
LKDGCGVFYNPRPSQKHFVARSIMSGAREAWREKIGRSEVRPFGGANNASGTVPPEQYANSIGMEFVSIPAENVASVAALDALAAGTGEDVEVESNGEDSARQTPAGGWGYFENPNFKNGSTIPFTADNSVHVESNAIRYTPVSTMNPRFPAFFRPMASESGDEGDFAKQFAARAGPDFLPAQTDDFSRRFAA